ncbi:hypothetical protein C5E45_23660 [Nocardia nova]|uniref:Uncharacterized protein n=1 Tax=Nocardia nova TaxID=37330 RepID=A0A2S6AKP5_9NOCA|nr:hypothetical protein [Nocardia nova]PPJ35811.1 hypothetical protein C5E45_23660 [Nocardia nova]
MAVRFKLGTYSPTDGAEPMGREWVGWFPRMTEEEAWESGRGTWKANPERLGREKFALITGGGTVLAIGEIDEVVPYDDRYAVQGPLLTKGHPVYDAWIGQPDPAANNSQNPVGYIDLPEEAEFRKRLCACDCGGYSTRDFLPGHDLRAIQDRVRRYAGGSVLTFIKWIDDTAHAAGVPLLPNNDAA